jgi:alanine-glyoxylate transaminase/(R)-3-amino-2-methylpropionate-pyruvate transaminase
MAMNTPSLPSTPFAPQPYTGPTAAAVLAQRQQFLSPGLVLYYQKPLMVV